MNLARTDDSRGSLIHFPTLISSSFILWVSWLVLGDGRNPDAQLDFVAILSVIAVFATFLLSLVGWGDGLSRILFRVAKEHWLVSLILGAAFISFFVLFLGFGSIGPESRLLFAICVCMGSALVRPRKLGPIISSLKLASWIERGILLYLAVFFLFRVFKSLGPWAASDPLIYHLYAPRLWMDHGSVYLPPGDIVIFHAGQWEYLILFGMRLLSGEVGRGLIEGQIFAQLLHTVLGFMGTYFAAYYAARRLFQANDLIALVAALAAISVRDLLWVTVLAKNDWGSLFFLVGGLSLVFDRPRVGAFILGVAGVSKFTNGPLAIAIVALALWIRKSSVREWGVSIGFFGLAALPLAVRNVIFTQNPIFPIMDDLFPSRGMTDGALTLVRYYLPKDSLEFSQRLERLASIISSESWILLVLIGVAVGVILRKKKESPALRIWMGLSGILVAVFILLLLQQARLTDRHLGAEIALIGWLTVIGISILIQALSSRIQVSVLSCIFLSLVAYGDSIRPGNYGDAPVFHALTDSKISDWHLAIRDDFRAGSSKAWLRMNVRPGEKILTTGDNQLYYISGLPVKSWLDSNPVPVGDLESLSPDVIIRRLISEKVRYLLDDRYIGVRTYYSYWIDSWISAHPAMTVFEAKDQRVIDLSLFREIR